MDYIVLFDATDCTNELDWTFVLIGVAILPVFIFLVKHMISQKKINFSFILYCVAILIVATAFIYVPVSKKKSDDALLERYVNGDYLECEGEIVDFSKYGDDGSERHERFCVNGVEFLYSYSEGPFYDTLSADGGYITENGQRVKIRYIQTDYQDNLIMRLEMVKDDLPDDTMKEKGK